MKCRYLYRIAGIIILIMMIPILFCLIRIEYNNASRAVEDETDIKLCINEVMYSNIGLQKDSDGDNSSWIEIYNYGLQDVSLLGKTLTLNYDGTDRWRFPDYKLKAGEYIIVWASGKNKAALNGELHSNFLLGKDDSIFLNDENGKTIDTWELSMEPPIGNSVGHLLGDFDTIAVLSASSPGKPNIARPVKYAVKVDRKIEPPVFSHESGYYDKDFDLTITSKDDSVIVYTLDGSEPDQNSPIYTEPIHIKDRSDEQNKIGDTKTTYDYLMDYKWDNTYDYKGTVVRARSMKAGVLSKEIVTKSYFISPATTFDVVSLTVDAEDMFDEHDGIYLPGETYQLWKKYNKLVKSDFSSPANYYDNHWINGHVQIIDKSGEICNDNDIKVKVSGSSSRSNAAKSLRFFIDDNDSYFDGNLFEILPVKNSEDKDLYSDECDAITLRPSDSDFNRTMFCDVLAESLAAESMDVSYLAAQPSVLFINGEYWGIHNIREVCNANYFLRHYDINSENLALLKLNNGVVAKTEVEIGTESDLDDYNDLVRYALSHDLNRHEFYNYVCSKVDIDSLIDYCIAEMYFANYDWPGNNFRIWKADQPDTSYGDNKWRFVIFDLDRAFKSLNFNSVAYVFDEKYDEAIVEGMNHYHDENRELFYSLIKNEEFKDKFFNRFEECLNTAFSEKNVVDKIEYMEKLYGPEMEGHFSRWHLKNGWMTKLKLLLNQGISYDDVYTYTNWKTNVEGFKYFARERPQVLKKYIREYLENSK